jgi:transposase-like protein
MARLNPKHDMKPRKADEAAAAEPAPAKEERTAPVAPPASPDPEVSEHVRRRTFSAAYKLRILREAEACEGPGEIGALLRREGLYSSHLTSWRRQRDEGALKLMSSQRRGPKPRKNPLAKQVHQLERENARLQRRLEQAEAIIAIQKKVSELLGIPLNGPRTDEND